MQNATGDYLLRSVPACDRGATVELWQRCEPYTLSLQTNFVFPNGTFGAACPTAPTLVEAKVSYPPLQPGIPTVTVYDASAVSVAWTAPEDTGSCANYSFSLKLSAAQNPGNPIFEHVEVYHMTE